MVVPCTSVTPNVSNRTLVVRGQVPQATRERVLRDPFFLPILFVGVNVESQLSTRQESWSEYWQSGAMHSCVGSLDDAYGGAIGDYWRRAIAQWPRNTRLLDVATGNGPLPKLMASVNPELVIRGVDLADIAPPWWSASDYPNVRMIGNTALADAASVLSELEGSEFRFDVIVSQFGWEYIPRPDSVETCLELIMPGGRWQFVCHHAQGVLARVARSEVSNLQLLLAEDGLLAQAMRMIPYVREAATGGSKALSGDPQANAVRLAFNAAMNTVSAQIASSSAPDVLVQVRQGVHDLLQRTARDLTYAADAQLDQWRRHLDTGLLRSTELVDHALTAHDVDAIFQQVSAIAPGVQCNRSELTQEQGTLAWALEFQFAS